MFFAVVLLTLAALSGCGGGGGSFATGSALTDSTDTGAIADHASGNTTTTTDTGAAGTAAGEQIPVIVTYKAAPGAAEAGRLRHVGGRARQGFTLIPATAATMTEQAMAELAKDPAVAYVERDGTVHASAETVNWNITKVSVSTAWSANNMGAGVKVAIIDTGIDYTHPDLAPNYKGGYNFIAKTNNPMDDNGHGTHVAGIIAAANNGSGLEGVAPKASLYALKILNKDGYGSYSGMIAALQWAVKNRMKVVSMSLGSTANSKVLNDACKAAYKAGLVLVAAAGNSGTPDGSGDTIDKPAAFGSVIAVGAVDSSNRRATWSSTGPQLELAAPGVDIVSTRLGGGTISMSGTSMACPHVSGVVALLVAAGITQQTAIRQRLQQGATDQLSLIHI